MGALLCIIERFSDIFAAPWFFWVVEITLRTVQVGFQSNIFICSDHGDGIRHSTNLLVLLVTSDDFGRSKTGSCRHIYLLDVISRLELLLQWRVAWWLLDSSSGRSKLRHVRCNFNALVQQLLRNWHRPPRVQEIISGRDWFLAFNMELWSWSHRGGIRLQCHHTSRGLLEEWFIWENAFPADRFVSRLRFYTLQCANGIGIVWLWLFRRPIFLNWT